MDVKYVSKGGEERKKGGRRQDEMLLLLTIRVVTATVDGSLRTPTPAVSEFFPSLIVKFPDLIESRHSHRIDDCNKG